MPQIQINCDTSDAKIYYTTNGGDPNILYSSPFEINEECTIKAIGRKEGYLDSDISSKTILKLPTPEISVNILGGFGNAYCLQIHNESNFPEGTQILGEVLFNRGNGEAAKIDATLPMFLYGFGFQTLTGIYDIKLTCSYTGYLNSSLELTNCEINKEYPSDLPPLKIKATYPQTVEGGGLVNIVLQAYSENENNLIDGVDFEVKDTENMLSISSSDGITYNVDLVNGSHTYYFTVFAYKANYNSASMDFEIQVIKI